MRVVFEVKRLTIISFLKHHPTCTEGWHVCLCYVLIVKSQHQPLSQAGLQATKTQHGAVQALKNISLCGPWCLSKFKKMLDAIGV